MMVPLKVVKPSTQQQPRSKSTMPGVSIRKDKFQNMVQRSKQRTFLSPRIHRDGKGLNPSRQNPQTCFTPSAPFINSDAGGTKDPNEYSLSRKQLSELEILKIQSDVKNRYSELNKIEQSLDCSKEIDKDNIQEIDQLLLDELQQYQAKKQKAVQQNSRGRVSLGPANSSTKKKDERYQIMKESLREILSESYQESETK